ncbi:DUF4025 domain-containing protein [Filobacillus milosensis]|uniref:DUF4025 domain-containing protein n=1 Tax=Filobacillus milosensis TaxID=94137 RepID=A0A4Y8IK54_9BACI|nr:YozQ family protein [Filobacillus milosensis]TFB21382.1 DUF4025 domain-containing protein [Filobacillus milosensis]
MVKKKKNSEQEDSNKIAEKGFEASDYEGNTQLEQGLAETHEQVSDVLHEGTIDRKHGKED